MACTMSDPRIRTSSVVNAPDPHPTSNARCPAVTWATVANGSANTREYRPMYRSSAAPMTEKRLSLFVFPMVHPCGSRSDGPCVARTLQLARSRARRGDARSGPQHPRVRRLAE